MQAWYYWSNNCEFGPVTKHQLFTLFQDKHIASYNFVRLEGSQDWTTYKELAIQQEDFSQEELDNPVSLVPEHFPAKAPSPENAPNGCPGSWQNTSPHPWRRYFARWVDIFLFLQLIIYPTLKLATPDTLTTLITNSSLLEILVFNVTGHIIFFSLIMLFNSILMATTGSTLGKWIFGIKILDCNKQPLDFKSALKREFYVLKAGLAFGIPVINLISHVHGYIDLSMDKTTSWDKKLKTVIAHRENSTKQFFLCILGIAIYFMIANILYLPSVIPI